MAAERPRPQPLDPNSAAGRQLAEDLTDMFARFEAAIAARRGTKSNQETRKAA